MKLLVVGGGGREHALAWALRRDDPSIEVFCAPGNPEQLAKTILKLVGKTGTLQRMGMQARDRATENFSITRMLDDVEKLYREIVKER